MELREKEFNCCKCMFRHPTMCTEMLAASISHCILQSLPSVFLHSMMKKKAFDCISACIASSKLVYFRMLKPQTRLARNLQHCYFHNHIIYTVMQPIRCRVYIS